MFNLFAQYYFLLYILIKLFITNFFASLEELYIFVIISEFQLIIKFSHFNLIMLGLYILA